MFTTLSESISFLKFETTSANVITAINRSFKFSLFRGVWLHMQHYFMRERVNYAAKSHSKPLMILSYRGLIAAEGYFEVRESP